MGESKNLWADRHGYTFLSDPSNHCDSTGNPSSPRFDSPFSLLLKPPARCAARFWCEYFYCSLPRPDQARQGNPPPAAPRGGTGGSVGATCELERNKTYTTDMRMRYILGHWRSSGERAEMLRGDGGQAPYTVFMSRSIKSKGKQRAGLQVHVRFKKQLAT
ncbi:unnamed protein product [Pleuronectes platessa]|uniref:Uncharacterized protein n=1 Tax=Pleuronectes platessa TaxID=8262 RepID=A0A9N7YFQ2_PLEPL|nr:unnamed protein product [Pleuronectes platessa]